MELIISNSGLWDSSSIITAPYLDGGNYVLRRANITYKHNKVATTNVGMVIFSDGYSPITDNVLVNGDYGMLLMGNHFVVEDNKFYSWDIGITSLGTNLSSHHIYKTNRFYNVDQKFIEMIPFAQTANIRGADGSGQ